MTRHFTQMIFGVNQRYLAWLFVFCHFFAVISCQSPSEQSKNKLKIINARLGWQVNANSAGQIAALEKGFYANRGLDIRLLPGGLTDPSIKTVAAEVDGVGFANSPMLVFKARSLGAPLKIVSSIQNIGYHCFFVKDGSGIKSPMDWKGRKIGVKYSSPTFHTYLMLLAVFGIDRQEVEEVPVNYGLQSFIEGEIDVYPGALTNELISLEQIGINIFVIRPEDYGVVTSGNVIITSENFLLKNRRIVNDFVQATLDGWRWALKPENEAEAVKFLKKHNARIDLDKETRAIRENRKLIAQANIGEIDTVQFQTILDQMTKFDILDGQVTLKDVVENLP